MKIPLVLAIHNLPHSEALERRIREKAAKLDEFHPRITSCRVTVGEMRKHHAQGRHFQVSVGVRVPGKEIVANRAHDEDVYVAVRDAFDAAKRQLEENVRVKRGDVKVHEVQFIEETAAEGAQAKRVSAGKHHLLPA